MYRIRYELESAIMRTVNINAIVCTAADFKKWYLKIKEVGYPIVGIDRKTAEGWKEIRKG